MSKIANLLAPCVFGLESYHKEYRDMCVFYLRLNVNILKAETHCAMRQKLL